jgi:hypothetical protein
VGGVLGGVDEPVVEELTPLLGAGGSFGHTTGGSGGALLQAEAIEATQRARSGLRTGVLKVGRCMLRSPRNF